MKKKCTLLFLIFPFLVFAQNNGKVFELVNNVKIKTGDFQSFDVFTAAATKATANYASAVEDGVIVTFDQAKVATLLQENPDEMQLTIPLKSSGEMVQLDLVQVDVFSEDFKAFTNTGQDITNQFDRGKHYRGVITGDAYSLVSLSIFKDQIIGFVSNSEGNYVIGRLENSETEHIIYLDTDLKLPNELRCETEDDGVMYSEEELNYQTANRDPGDCVNIYIEAGQSVFLAFGSNLANTTAFLTGVFAQSYVVYANDGITLQTQSMFIWQTPDPYSGGDTSAQLSAFQTNTGAFVGDLGHLVEVQNIGGQAAGFSGICAANSDNSLCFSGFSGTGFNNVPTYSFNVQIITHEMGHLLGSRHTHACVWNGNGTAIDSCSGFTEGACPLPGPVNPGTVMSYCGSNISLAQGFHPQPTAVILSNINAPGNCLTTCGACVAAITCPVNVTVNNDFGTCEAAGVVLGTPTTNSCAGETVSNDAPAIFPIGVTTVTWTVTGSGGPVSCTQIVTVNDSQNPTISCPANITQGIDTGMCSAVVNFTVTSTDNCSGQVVVNTPASGSVFAVGTTIVTSVVTDAAGNTATCSFDVMVNDTENPTISCPANITQGIDTGMCSAVVNFTVTSTDNCSGQVVVNTPASGSVFVVGTTTVTSVVTDVAGNTVNCSFDITVNDTEDPVAVCQNITIQLDANGDATITAAQLDGGSSDNCNIASIVIGNDTFNCSNLGVNTVTLTVTDADGNSNSCTATVTVEDSIDPVFDSGSLPGDQERMADANGEYVLEDFTTGVIVTDNCSITEAVIIIDQDPAVGTVLTVGVYDITLTATDDLGNDVEYVFELEVTAFLSVGDNANLSSLAMYPNPTSSYMVLSNPDNMALQYVAIYDLMGRLIQTINLENMGTQKNIDVSNLANATYMILIKGTNGQITKQLIKK